MLPSTTINDVKTQIHTNEGIPVDAQLLKFAIMDLKDGKTIADYCIPENYTTLVVFRLHRLPYKLDDESENMDWFNKQCPGFALGGRRTSNV